MNKQKSITIKIDLRPFQESESQYKKNIEYLEQYCFDNFIAFSHKENGKKLEAIFSFNGDDEVVEGLECLVSDYFLIIG